MQDAGGDSSALLTDQDGHRHLISAVRNFGETPDLGYGFGYLSKPLLDDAVIDFPFYSYPEPPIIDRQERV